MLSRLDPRVGSEPFPLLNRWLLSLAFSFFFDFSFVGCWMFSGLLLLVEDECGAQRDSRFDARFCSRGFVGGYTCFRCRTRAFGVTFVGTPLAKGRWAGWVGDHRFILRVVHFFFFFCLPPPMHY